MVYCEQQVFPWFPAVTIGMLWVSLETATNYSATGGGRQSQAGPSMESPHSLTKESGARSRCSGVFIRGNLFLFKSRCSGGGEACWGAAHKPPGLPTATCCDDDFDEVLLRCWRIRRARWKSWRTSCATSPWPTLSPWPGLVGGQASITRPCPGRIYSYCRLSDNEAL